MDFSLNEAQTLLRDSVNKYLGNDYGFAQRRASAASDRGYSAEQWARFAEFGWLAVPFAEQAGGYGGRIEDCAVLGECFGRALVLEPYLATVMLTGRLLERGGAHALLGTLMDGSRQGALAALERHSRQNFTALETTATRRAGGYVLSGSKALVLNGASADVLVVSARSAGAALDRNGISLFIVDGSAAGLERTAVPMMDGSRAANLVLNDVQLEADACLGEPGQGWALLEPVLQEARIATCAEALGIIDTLREKTVEYSRTRSQFGTPLGSFQALQHRMVDMLIAAEQSRSILYRAICEYQQGEDSARATIAAMKSCFARYGRLVGEEAIQIHGGMGMTDELDIGHYVKRLMVLNQLFGDADSTLREFCAASYAA